ncbi:inositol monophosphatase [Evansella sp. AB-rgal1]|uniref:inositol monophosphatase family protein n=1 Tax=Evansella sp. AB-rgal1 TaxID=3242696 RepID=UPI00359D2DBD
MTDINWDQLYDDALRWTREAGEYIKEKMKESYSIDTKANQNDLVTDVDKSVEQFFQQKIGEGYPEHRLMGEEGSHESIHDLTGVVWILDPIDGTINFVHQESFFAISLGIFHEGVGMIGIVYDVMNGELFTAQVGKGAYLNEKKLNKLSEVSFEESILSFNPRWILKNRGFEKLITESRAVRCYGSAAIEIAYVAAGKLDGYICNNLAPWDIAGGSVILAEVGGVSSNYDGGEQTYLKKDTFIAANPSIHRDVLKRVQNN